MIKLTSEATDYLVDGIKMVTNKRGPMRSVRQYLEDKSITNHRLLTYLKYEVGMNTIDAEIIVENMSEFFSVE